MGCGSSKLAEGPQSGAVPQTTKQTEEAKLPAGASVPANQPASKLFDTPTTTATASDDTQLSSSRDSTPNPAKQTTKGRSSRTFAQRAPSGSLGHLSAATLAGPDRDYAGLPLEKRDNDRLSHITTLAGTIMKTSCALIVLGRGDRMVLASSAGTDDEDDTWLPAFCAWALSQESGVLSIEDLGTDRRTASLLWVQGEPNIRFYSGCTLHKGTGERLGVLCVMDFDEPRLGGAPLSNSLPNLAQMVIRELQTDDEQGSRMEVALFRAMDTYWDGSVLVDTNVGKWQIKYANEAFAKMTGIERSISNGKDLWDLVEMAGSATTRRPWERFSTKAKSQEGFEIYSVIPTPGRPRSKPNSRELQKRFKVHMRPNSETIMNNYGLAPEEKDIKGIYFAVFTEMATDSTGSYSTAINPDDDLVPFDDVEMGPIIGKGSFGSVFRAAWNGRLVALKVIEFADIAKVDSAGNPLEASLMLEMKHRNIVETIQHCSQQRALYPFYSQLGVGKQIQGFPIISSSPQKEAATDQSPSHGGAITSNMNSVPNRPNIMESWLMLEYCDLGSLSDCIENGVFHEQLRAGLAGAEVPVPKMTFILETAKDIAQGLEHIHSHNILHGDLTAGNVLLQSRDSSNKKKGDRDFIAKIADFGLSRQAITSKVETNTYGTVTHMPPELLNEGILSKAADVYAFGVLLFEVFTKRRVWEGLRHPQIIHAIAVQKKHPVLPDTAPQAYKDLANKCMAAEPEDRPTFSQIVKELDQMLHVKL